MPVARFVRVEVSCLGSTGFGLSCRKFGESFRNLGFRILVYPSRNPFCKTFLHDLECMHLDVHIFPVV